MIYQVKRFGPPLLPWNPGLKDLAVILAKNYERRCRGQAPDEWHWADEILLVCGYYLERVA